MTMDFLEFPERQGVTTDAATLWQALHAGRATTWVTAFAPSRRLNAHAGLALALKRRPTTSSPR
jgi:hypothetical protein